MTKIESPNWPLAHEVSLVASKEELYAERLRQADFPRTANDFQEVAGVLTETAADIADPAMAETEG